VTGSATGTVLVIDDQELVAVSLVYTLSMHGLAAHRIAVTGIDAARESALTYPPGVALLDLDLGAGDDGQVLDGVNLVAPLREHGWAVLVVTGTTDLDRVAAAVTAGAANWVVKGADLTELVTATTELAAGRGVLPESQRHALVQRHLQSERGRRQTADKFDKLSPKEREVLDRLTAGASAADIAAETWTSIRTVRAHIRNILAKLEVNSQGAATALAREHRSHAPPIQPSVWRQLRGDTAEGWSSR
jgi:DNA-binding NarL/FixJ family response regulator